MTASSGSSRDARRLATAWLLAAAVLAGGVAALSGAAAAHGGSLREAAGESLTVPLWLFLATGGGAVGASFLLASFVTDRAFVRSMHEWGGRLPAPGRVARALARLVAVGLLGLTLVAGLLGPSGGRNPAVLLVWIGWWAGFTLSVYLVGNAWPAVNPFRAVASPLPSLDRPYPERLGAWPSVAGLLALVWIEVVTPLASDPRLLAATVAGYGALTVAGAVALGPDRWFGTVDPVSRLFAAYGRVAPLYWQDGLRVRLPGSGLTDPGAVADRSEVAFVVAVVFGTTYDGFVGTALWGDLARAVVGLGAPPLAVYLAAYLGGFGLFLGAYWGAARLARRYADTFLTTASLARRFAPALLAIAAGYHLAHYLGLFLTLAPSLAVALTAPLAPPAPLPTLVVPAWFGGVELAAVLVGHVLAVWVAHSVAYELFPSRLQAVRSQYGTTLVMVLYTMTSLWIVSRPPATPPFV